MKIPMAVEFHGPDIAVRIRTAKKIHGIAWSRSYLVARRGGYPFAVLGIAGHPHIRRVGGTALMGIGEQPGNASDGDGGEWSAIPGSLVTRPISHRDRGLCSRDLPGAMSGTVSKRCSCRGANGRQLGSRCPKLRHEDGDWRSEHGTWGYQIDLPPTADGRRRQIRRGGLASDTDAHDALGQIRTLLADPADAAEREQAAALIVETLRAGGPLPEVDDLRHRSHRRDGVDPRISVAAWLQTWLAGRRRISESTRAGYQTNIRLHLNPAIGHLRLDRLSVADLDDLFDGIEVHNETIRRLRATGTPEEKQAIHGRRAIGAASKQRIRATLRAALNHAIRLGLITHNPASYVELPTGRPPRALLWTEARVTRWRETGEIPSPVMVWTPAQLGAFLDHAEPDPLYPLFHLVAHRGLRRGEACGLHWADVDLATATLTVRWQIVRNGAATELKKPKSDAADRQIPSTPAPWPFCVSTTPARTPTGSKPDPPGRTPTSFSSTPTAPPRTPQRSAAVSVTYGQAPACPRSDSTTSATPPRPWRSPPAPTSRPSRNSSATPRSRSPPIPTPTSCQNSPATSPKTSPASSHAPPDHTAKPPADPPDLQGFGPGQRRRRCCPEAVASADATAPSPPGSRRSSANAFVTRR